jgi:diguanylate cyclase (GGDEF)-like protein/PAS domain S-box-containing protein
MRPAARPGALAPGRHRTAARVWALALAPALGGLLLAAAPARAEAAGDASFAPPWVLLALYAFLLAAMVGLVVLLRRARAQEQEQTRLLQGVVQAFDGYIYVCGPDRRIRFANRALHLLAGGDATGRLCHEVLHGLDAPCEWCCMDRVLKGETVHWEARSPADGRRYRITSSPVVGEDGAVAKQAMIQDVTVERRDLDELRARRKQLRTIIDENADALFVVDAAGTLRFMNRAAEGFFGKSAEEMVGGFFGLPMAEGDCGEIDVPRADGSVLVAEMCRTPMVWEQEGTEAVATLVSLRNVTERKRIEEKLRESEERYRTVADYTHDWEVWLAVDGSVRYMSPSCERISGYPAERFIRDPAFIEQIIHRDDVALYRQYMTTPTRWGKDSIDFRFFRKDGRMGWLSLVTRRVEGDGRELGLRASMRDVTDRKLMETELRHQALHDPLTGLANRTLLRDRVRLALERSGRRDDYHYALVFMDLDRFKVINDSLGHAFGDKLLLEICNRLIHCVRGLDTVSRHGGDEFVFLLEELESPREAIRIVKRVREAIMRTISIDGHEVKATASFGIFLGPTTSDRPEDVIQNANIAMHYAKELGRDRIKVFTSKLLDRAVQMLTLEHDMRRGIPAGEFELYYQPIVSLTEQRIMGFEALVRWNHPERGLLGPGEFIPLAEDTGLIVDLGQWVLHEGCRTMAQWRAETPRAAELILSVNISGKQFSQVSLVDQIRAILSETGFPPDRLKLEITETAIMDNADFAIDKLNRLKLMGISISIDDFGTGYSSMSHLQRFPLDHLKIDLSFVQQMDAGPESQEIVRAIVNLAHNLKLKVIAEGVETDAHRRALSSMACEYAQGFFFSRPVPRLKAHDLILADLPPAPGVAATAEPGVGSCIESGVGPGAESGVGPGAESGIESGPGAGLGDPQA